MCRMSMGVSAFESLWPEDVFTYPYHGHTTIWKFLPALEVGWVQNQGSQKVDKNMDFWLSGLVPTDSVGKEVYFMHYYTGSTCFC